MSGSSGLPGGWDPDKDSLEALVRRMFRRGDDRPRSKPAEPAEPSKPAAPAEPAEPAASRAVEPAAPAEPSKPAEPAAAAAAPEVPEDCDAPGSSRDQGAPQAPEGRGAATIGTTRPSPTPPGAEPPTPRPSQPGASAERRRRRIAAGALAVVIVAVLAFTGWQVRGGAPAAVPGDAPPPVDPQTSAAMALTTAVQAPTAAGPAPVGIAFPGRADVGEGWRIAVTRPYLCTVLMAVPALQKPGTRIVRVSVTLINRTGSTQPANAWSLDVATSGGTAELVLWPAEGFRGVPDVLVAPGRSVRFLVAVRIPDEPTRVDVRADRGTATRAVLAGTL